MGDARLRGNFVGLRSQFVRARGVVENRVRVKVLGSAAGGGFPQWNCGCPNCRGVRSGRLKAKPRTQSQVAVSNDDHWFLLNASPELRGQIEATQELHPRATRHTPTEGIVITSADLDHVLGLLLLRELQPMHVYSTPSIRRILREDNSFFRMLSQSTAQIECTDITPGIPFRLAPVEAGCSLLCRPIALPGRFPPYVTEARASTLSPSEAVIGLVVEAGEGSGGRLGFFPGVAELNDELLSLFDSCALLLVDGTFWTDDELIALGIGDRTARQMDHLPISGRDGSLAQLATLPCRHRIYTHINNTNPMLVERSPESALVERAGLTIGVDGLSISV